MRTRRSRSRTDSPGFALETLSVEERVDEGEHLGSATKHRWVPSELLGYLAKRQPDTITNTTPIPYPGGAMRFATEVARTVGFRLGMMLTTFAYRPVRFLGWRVVADPETFRHIARPALLELERLAIPVRCLVRSEFSTLVVGENEQLAASWSPLVETIAVFTSARLNVADPRDVVRQIVWHAATKRHVRASRTSQLAELNATRWLARYLD